jgi:hypothetical protein
LRAARLWVKDSVIQEGEIKPIAIASRRFEFGAMLVSAETGGATRLFFGSFAQLMRISANMIGIRAT